MTAIKKILVSIIIRGIKYNGAILFFGASQNNLISKLWCKLYYLTQCVDRVSIVLFLWLYKGYDGYSQSFLYDDGNDDNVARDDNL